MSPRKLSAELAVPTTRQEDMRHPLTTWTDPSYADEPLEELREAYLDFCRGRAKPASPQLGFVHFASGWSLSRSRAPGGQSELRWSFVDVMFSADIQKLRRKLVHQIGIDRAQPPQFTPYGQSLAQIGIDRAQPPQFTPYGQSLAQTVSKYNKVLLSFIRSLERNGDPPLLGSVIPATVNRWVNERRSRGLSEEGIATHLIALKVFTSKFIYRELELTTVDLLRKVSRITPPEKPAQVLTEEERERVLACFDQPTYEDTRNVALIACYMATGLRFNEILELTMDSLDRIRGDITVTAKGGKERPARLSPRAMKYVREYLRIRPRSDSDRVWLTAEGTPLTYNGAQEMFRKLKKRSGVKRLHSHLLRHGFAQAALAKGAHPGMVQEMLGHSTPTMTRRYLGWAKQEEAAKQMPEFAPI